MCIHLNLMIFTKIIRGFIRIKHLGQDTKYGSSFIVMTIIGGGIVTPVMGFVSDAAGNIPTAELVPALCFAIIFIFARFRSQAATN